MSELIKTKLSKNFDGKYRVVIFKYMFDNRQSILYDKIISKNTVNKLMKEIKDYE